MQWTRREAQGALVLAVLVATALHPGTGMVRGRPAPVVRTSSLTNVRAAARRSSGDGGRARGRFIPFSSWLLAAPGYVVPPYSWQYMNRRNAAPDGWLQDVGLPLTKAVRATVTNGAVRRAIVLQAFQDALLTYDARNPPAWRVERAISGADYARAFPQAGR